MAEDMLRIMRLKKPEGPVDVVLDTDTFNEIDDQFALSYLVKSENELRLQGIYAAPFLNKRASSPEDGMERSYQEIYRVLELLEREDLKSKVHRGSASYLPDEHTPVHSDAAEHLAELAMQYTEEKPLYVIAIAAITNIASALLLKPEIADRIVVVWLGGESFEWPHNREFNCYQDVAAVRVVFDSKAAVVLLPCMGVVSAFATTRYELEHWLKGKNKLCDYLCDVVIGEAEENNRGKFWSKPIWDVCAVAWLLKGDFMADRLEPAPIAEYDDRWAFDKTRPLIRYVYHIYRDRLIEDLFTKLAE
ncbi:MAG: nucleoside hydrolase [Lachnospiraceae bacterium]|nr:nucleoside hydrolase [Lachnospiraceae bacterium]